MATVNKIFKPRRGKKSTMAGTKANTVLAAGELFLETPDTGVGKGASKIKIGDGSTAYKSLPYALGDTTNDVITYSSNSSTTVATALNNVASGKKLGLMIAGLKQAVSLLNTSVTSLNDDISNIEKSFQDGCSTIAAKITSLGVNTAANASIDTICTNIESLYNSNLGYQYELGNFVDLTGKNINSITVENGHTYMYASVWSATTFTGCEILDEFSSKGSAGAVCHVYIVKATSDIITVKSHSSDPRVFLKLG